MARLERVFRAYARELEAYLNRRLRDPETAADLTQDTFLRYAEAERGSAVVNDRSYLFQTARNLAIDHVRQADRHRTDTTPPEELAGIVEDAPTIEQAAWDRQRLCRLEQAVAAMPERTRQVFCLVRIDGLSYAQAAGLLAISESSVKKHLARAVAHVLDHGD